jgi:hypothetical protein
MEIYAYSELPLQPPLIFSSIDTAAVTPENKSLEIRMTAEVINDVLLRVFAVKKGLPVSPTGKSKELFHILLHSSFVDNVQVRLKRKDLDGYAPP